MPVQAIQHVVTTYDAQMTCDKGLLVFVIGQLKVGVVQNAICLYIIIIYVAYLLPIDGITVSFNFKVILLYLPCV